MSETQTPQWQQTFTLFRKHTIDNTYVGGHLMRRRDEHGNWLYRELTEAEFKDYVSAEAW